MVCAGCHAGEGIICLDEANASAPCRRDPNRCGWAKYPDITYKFRVVKMDDGWSVDIPSNAIAINTNTDSVSYLEPVIRKKDEKRE